MSEEEETAAMPPPVEQRPLRPTAPIVDEDMMKTAYYKKVMQELEEGEKPEGLSFTDYLMYIDVQDRRERARREEARLERLDKQPKPQLTAEQVASIVETKVKELVNPPKAEPSEEMQTLLSTVEALTKRLDAQDEETKTQKLLKEATEPLNAAIEKRDEQIKQLQGQIEKITDRLEQPSTQPPGGEDPITFYLNTRDRLRDAGILKEEKASGMITLSGPEGMPIKGEMPGWAVWVPWLIDRGLTSFEESLNRIGQRYGLIAKLQQKAQPPAQPVDLIRLPPKPTIPPPPPAQEIPSASEPEKMPEIKPPVSEEIIKIPEKPVTVEAKVEEVSVGYAKEDLEKMKMVQLWKIAKELGVSKKGKKTELIDRILKARSGFTIMPEEEDKGEQKEGSS